jgi:hypothetical protein
VGAVKDRVSTRWQKMADFCGFSGSVKDCEGSYLNARQAREKIHTAGVLIHINPSQSFTLTTYQGLGLLS